MTHSGGKLNLRESSGVTFTVQTKQELIFFLMVKTRTDYESIPIKASAAWSA